MNKLLFNQGDQNLCLIVVGMAGSGKTTFVSGLKNSLIQDSKFPYVINLDPAVQFLPYSPDFDIRQHVDYKKTMKEYKLGPNGGIMTSLNLFAGKIDILIEQVKEKKNNQGQVFIIDTPGQIEVFNWSASGQIIATTLASIIPTAILFVSDVVRCENPNTFMQNMLFCCSVLFRLKLPIHIVFNKCDKVQQRVQQKWMEDYDTLLQELQNYSEQYLSSLSRSLCLALDDFYRELSSTYISSLNGQGYTELILEFNKLREEFYKGYYEDMKQSLEELKLSTKKDIDEKKNEFKESLKKNQFKFKQFNKSKCKILKIMNNQV